MSIMVKNHSYTYYEEIYPLVLPIWNTLVVSLQPEEFGHCFQWIDSDVSIKDHNRLKLLLEMKEVELGHNGTKDFSMIEYSGLLDITSPKP